MPGVSGLSGVNGMTGGGGMPGVSRIIRSERIIRRRRDARRGRLDTSMPIAWIIGPAAHLFHAAMKLFEPLGF